MITITQVDQGRKGYFLAQEDTNEAGRMTYTWAGTGKFIIDHTEVNSDFSGRGVGKKRSCKLYCMQEKMTSKFCLYAPLLKVSLIKTLLFTMFYLNK